MALLKKIEYVIKDSSTAQISTQIASVTAQLNNTQNLSANKDGGEFKTYYFGALFDPRAKKNYIIFSDATKSKFDMKQSSYELANGGGGGADMSNYLTKAEVEVNYVSKASLDADYADVAFLTSL